jgi:hypothetical protein
VGASEPCGSDGVWFESAVTRGEPSPLEVLATSVSLRAAVADFVSVVATESALAAPEEAPADPPDEAGEFDTASDTWPLLWGEPISAVVAVLVSFASAPLV